MSLSSAFRVASYARFHAYSESSDWLDSWESESKYALTCRYRCIFRLCKHPHLDSVTAGTSGEERLALLLEKMANSAVRTQPQHGCAPPNLCKEPIEKYFETFVGLAGCC